MKQVRGFVLISVLVLLAWTALSTVHADMTAPRTMTARISKTFRFGGALLPAGEYLIVHDDAKKARGEPCLSIWSSGEEQEELASSYCQRVVRGEHTDGYLALRSVNRWLSEIAEIQFAGDVFAHVPQEFPPG